MKLTEPKLHDRAEQPYMGIRTQVSMAEMGSGVLARLTLTVTSESELLAAASPAPLLART